MDKLVNWIQLSNTRLQSSHYQLRENQIETNDDLIPINYPKNYHMYDIRQGNNYIFNPSDGSNNVKENMDILYLNLYTIDDET
jgi:hypothetical protein